MQLHLTDSPAEFIMQCSLRSSAKKFRVGYQQSMVTIISPRPKRRRHDNLIFLCVYLRRQVLHSWVCWTPETPTQQATGPMMLIFFSFSLVSKAAIRPEQADTNMQCNGRSPVCSARFNGLKISTSYLKFCWASDSQWM